MVTGAAGFTAAQSLADTALKARSTALVGGLQHHALQNVHVQMGKMHVGLGGFTYVLGFASSMVSLINHHQNWQQATRSGNAAAQNSAALATAGAAGMTTVNAYGLNHTGRAAINVLVAKKQRCKNCRLGCRRDPSLHRVLPLQPRRRPVHRAGAGRHLAVQPLQPQRPRQMAEKLHPGAWMPRNAAIIRWMNTNAI